MDTKATNATWIPKQPTQRGYQSNQRNVDTKGNQFATWQPKVTNATWIPKTTNSQHGCQKKRIISKNKRIISKNKKQKKIIGSTDVILWCWVTY